VDIWLTITLKHARLSCLGPIFAIGQYPQNSRHRRRCYEAFDGDECSLRYSVFINQSVPIYKL